MSQLRPCPCSRGPVQPPCNISISLPPSNSANSWSLAWIRLAYCSRLPLCLPNPTLSLARAPHSTKFLSSAHSHYEVVCCSSSGQVILQFSWPIGLLGARSAQGAGSWEVLRGFLKIKCWVTYHYLVTTQHVFVCVCVCVSQHCKYLLYVHCITASGCLTEPTEPRETHSGDL